MKATHVINVDLAQVWRKDDRKKLVRTLAWGDEVTVVHVSDKSVEVQFVYFKEEKNGTILPIETTGFIVPTKTSKLKPSDVIRTLDQNEVLKVNFVDVQQGDGTVIETPSGKVVLVDGGDNQLFARYLAGRHRGTTSTNPKEVECILVTHGDADHFVGLPKILESESNTEPRKRLFIQPKRIYHNGIVKRPSTKNDQPVPESELLGPTKTVDGKLMIVDLVDDLVQFDSKEMNMPFKQWQSALETYHKRSPLTFKRLQFGDDDAFDFMNENGIEVQVLGPLADVVDGKPALRFLGDPPHGARLGHESVSSKSLKSKGLSASHTINGHSVVLRIVYGGFSYLLSGDLNDEASRFLVQAHDKGDLNLTSEVFKVPHHGSADFSGAFFQKVSPIVSVVSSGDESARKEFMHPRATLMGALGRWSRVEEPLIFVTEMVAFFNLEGWSKLADAKASKKRGQFFGFSRTSFGIVKTRTDGKRLFVYTDSGNVELKEAYAYAIDANGVPQPSKVVKV